MAKLTGGQLWAVKRTVIETFEVWASSKDEALRVEKEPSSITVVKETAKPLRAVGQTGT
jgi:hypothetical protein